jgi:ankyrin repeat protein
LIAARGAKGQSVVVAAALLRRTDREGFVCTRANPVLSAVLARAPALDVFEAAVVGDIARVRALVAREPGLVTARNPIGWTPLHFAGFGGKLDAVKLLLERGAVLDARATNVFRNTPLQTASLCGEREVIAYLLERGADPNIRQGEGFGPLHDAAALGRIDIIQLLLDHGASINARGDTGATPLAIAVRFKETKAAAYLRGKGAVE